MKNKISEYSLKAYTGTLNFLERHGNKLLMVFGVVLLAGGMVELAEAQGGPAPKFQPGRIQGATGGLLGLIEGTLGALISVAAGIGAIIAASMGAYRAAVALMVVAVGAFILRSLVSLFFDVPNKFPSQFQPAF